MPEVTKQSAKESHEGIAVDHVGGQYRLMATRDFEVGEQILFLEGNLFDEPTKFSVQVGPGQHVDAPEEARADPPSIRYPWRSLNHSCEPNTKIDNRNLMAIRKIKVSEQITFNYNTTEHDLSSPFECHCGSDNCCGLVRGNRWQEDKARLMNEAESTFGLHFDSRTNRSTCKSALGSTA